MTKLDEEAKAFSKSGKASNIASDNFKSGWTAGREDLVREAERKACMIGGVEVWVIKLSVLKKLLEGSSEG